MSNYGFLLLILGATMSGVALGLIIGHDVGVSDWYNEDEDEYAFLGEDGE